VEDEDCQEPLALLRLQNKPANALTLEFCQGISNAIKKVESDQQSTTLVISSRLSNQIFSAGLDISTELYQPNIDRLPKFWNSFQQVFLDLYGTTKLSTIAAIGGPAPAGGCMLALSTDYKVMDARKGSKAVIGLNESKLGIVAPPWMCQQYIDVLGHSHAELALMLGTLFPPQQALGMGLVDELVEEEDPENSASNRYTPVEQVALARAKEFAKIPNSARGAVKELTRKPLLESLIQDRQRDVDFFCEFVTSEKAQHAIGKYLKAMAKKR